MLEKKNWWRIFGPASILLLGLLICALRLMDLQLVHWEEYRSQSERRIYGKVTVSAPRGEIFDRYGRPLTVNRTVYTVSAEAAFLPSEGRNDILLEVLNILEEDGVAYDTSTFPLQTVSRDPAFTGSEKEIAALRKEARQSKDATAAETLAGLCKRYGIDEDLPLRDRFRLAALRYDMRRAGFSLSVPFTLASDVPTQTVVRIEELSNSLPGIVTGTDFVREYKAGTLACHILGRVGAISRSEYEELAGEGYGLNSTIGKDGVERAFESYLRGTDGQREVETDNHGNVLSLITSKAPIAGANVLLTLDSAVQKAAELSLEQTIREIAEAHADGSDGYDACAGAVVAVNVKNGELVAMASYPNYDLSLYQKLYTQLANDAAAPLFNRALMGLYPPGSTFKMATAYAGLQDGVITTKTKISAQGTYELGNMTFNCWYYTDRNGTHGNINVSEAIKYSCNIFFYEVGNRLGIDKLAHYASVLGLGEATGVELPGEKIGLVANRQSREAAGKAWYPGDTVQAAIGQSDHLFTPLQLANYVATLANGGTRYKVHVLQSVTSNYYGAAVFRQPSVVMAEADISKSEYEAIASGMRMVVSSGGTAASPFRNFEYTVAGKTGTASVASGTANGVFVAFAPYEDPQLAVCVIIEHGASGGNAAPVVRDIIDAYMAAKENLTNVTAANTLLK